MLASPDAVGCMAGKLERLSLGFVCHACSSSGGEPPNRPTACGVGGRGRWRAGQARRAAGDRRSRDHRDLLGPEGGVLGVLGASLGEACLAQGGMDADHTGTQRYRAVFWRCSCPPLQASRLWLFLSQ